MNWEAEKLQLQNRIQDLETLLQDSAKRQENATKLNSRLLDALNQIARQEDRNKEFLEEIQGLVMTKTLSTLHNISKISAQGHRNNTFQLSSIEKTERTEVSQERNVPRRSTVNRVNKEQLKENRNINQRPNLDKQQIKSLTAKLQRTRKLEHFDDRFY